jgi:hypothetical protein
MKLININNEYNIENIKYDLKSDKLLLLDFSNLETEEKKSKISFSIGASSALNFYILDINPNRIFLHKDEFEIEDNIFEKLLENIDEISFEKTIKDPNKLFISIIKNLLKSDDGANIDDLIFCFNKYKKASISEFTSFIEAEEFSKAQEFETCISIFKILDEKYYSDLFFNYDSSNQIVKILKSKTRNKFIFISFI